MIPVEEEEEEKEEEEEVRTEVTVVRWILIWKMESPPMARKVAVKQIVAAKLRIVNQAAI